MLQQQFNKIAKYWYNPINIDKKFLTKEKDMFKKVLFKKCYVRKEKTYSELIMLEEIFRDISSQKPLETILQTIYGFGYKRTSKIALLFSFGKESLAFKNLSSHHQERVVSLVERLVYNRKYRVKDSLINLRKKNITRLKKINCYRGNRHSLYLPVRGQRTHSNAHTARYLSSRTFEYIPRKPSSKVKMLSKFTRRKAHIVKAAVSRYHRLLNKAYNEFRKSNKSLFKHLEKKGKLGIFSKLHKAKVKLAKAKSKGKK